LDDNLYNLMEQLTTESKSLWQIRKHYRDDAKGCRECLEFWEGLERDKEDHIARLEGLIRKHLG